MSQPRDVDVIDLGFPLIAIWYSRPINIEREVRTFLVEMDNDSKEIKKVWI
jgi:hypothetical protein